MSVATRWQGFWEQAVWGRQPMRQVVLRFEGERIDGEGTDIIGRFTFQGEITPMGSVSLIKQYIGKHLVLYKGHYDGEGTISGTYSVGGLFTGPFVLFRDTEGAALDSALAAEPIELKGRNRIG